MEVTFRRVMCVYGNHTALTGLCHRMKGARGIVATESGSLIHGRIPTRREYSATHHSSIPAQGTSIAFSIQNDGHRSLQRWKTVPHEKSGMVEETVVHGTLADAIIVVVPGEGVR